VTVATRPLVTRPVVDPSRWPDLASSRARIRGGVERRLARRVFRSVTARLPLRVELPDGSLMGAAAQDPDAPVMRVHQPDEFFEALGSSGLIGFGESYMAGDWDAPDLARVLQVFAARVATLISAPLQRLRALYVAHRPAAEQGTSANARTNIARHYDLSNDLFASFLDDTLSYSSALFDDRQVVGEPMAGEAITVSTPRANAQWHDLAPAQQRKVDRVLDAAGVEQGTRLPEIGTGGGELAIRAAARGARVTTITLSSEQQALTRQRIADAGFADRVQVLLLDYRAVKGEYDAVVSVEMVEAVGHQFWTDYARALDRLLAPGGRVVIQAITMPHDRMLATRNTWTWINKYICPGGFLPSTQALDEVTRRHTTLRLVERLSFGQHYAQTLRLWDERFLSRLDRVRGLGFDEVFHRMWHFYLEYSRAGFQSGYLDVQQLVFTREIAG
jgi:cyclopropane-fatty-acyl-phospholipid synthase